MQLHSDRRHRLHDQPVEPEPRARHGILDLGSGGAHLLGAVETEQDAAGVGLVHEPGGDGLQR